MKTSTRFLSPAAFPMRRKSPRNASRENQSSIALQVKAMGGPRWLTRLRRPPGKPHAMTVIAAAGADAGVVDDGTKHLPERRRPSRVQSAKSSDLLPDTSQSFYRASRFQSIEIVA